MNASHLQHNIQFYQLHNCTVNIPKEFVIEELIHQQSPQVPHSEGAVTEYEKIKVSNIEN